MFNFKNSFALILVLFSITLSYAQDAYNSLNANQIKTGMHSNGSLFMDENKVNAGFWVPYDENITANPATIFSSAIWLGALDPNGNIKVSELTFGGQTDDEYLPGPYNSDLLNLDFDKVWKITVEEINALKADFADGTVNETVSQGLLEWPGSGNPYYNGELPQQFLAPFTDLNMDGIYDPYDGDYPSLIISGNEQTPDEMLYSIMHDDPETQFGGELHIILYAYESEEDKVLNTSVFARFSVINRRVSDLSDFRMGLWTDTDLGCRSDDYIGCDVSRNTHYVYNKDAEDGFNGTCNGTPIYTGTPPVMTITFLTKPMSSLISSNNQGTGSPHTASVDPATDGEVYRYLKGLWRDGTPLTTGGNGYDLASTDITKFIYPDDPADPSGWSMLGENIPLLDPRTIGVAQKEVLAPGEIFTLDIVINFTQDDTLDNISTVGKALENVDLIQELYDQGITSSSNYVNVAADFKIFPNPNSGSFTIDHSDGFDQYKILDKLGRVVLSGKLDQGKVDVSLPADVYFIQLEHSEKFDKLSSQFIIIN